MTLPPTNAATKRTQRRELAADKAYRILERIHLLPDDARIDVQVVAHLYDRSVSSVWRDVCSGRLPQPQRHGTRCVRWRLGDIRTCLKGGNQ